MSLAIFDLDNTLLHGDSDHAWGEFLCEKGIVDSELYRQANDTFYHQYVAGTLNIYEFLEFALKPLKELPRDQLNQLHEQFMREKVEPMITEKAEALLKQHRDKGDFLLIITATNKFVTGPIAARLGVDDIMATDHEEINGQYTGKVAGTPCFQGGKVERLKEWLSTHEHSLIGSSFYSDSRNDLPLLEVVENPVAVDADETLTQIATERGWPIISLRD
ncbi:histidinol-phosphatase [Neptunomonas phycophila]|uniref:histidinol-phosphatase n=1 Tax=Neptunomonas phycophila TaxID=1572645 RepID=UPI00351714CC